MDFSQFNLRLAYALAGKKPPRGDLYDITGNDANGLRWPILREGRKKLTNALINFDKPLTRWPGKLAEERTDITSHFPKGTTARNAIDDIKAKPDPADQRQRVLVISKAGTKLWRDLPDVIGVILKTAFHDADKAELETTRRVLQKATQQLNDYLRGMKT